MPQEATPALSLRGLTKRYGGIPVVNDLSLSIPPGEIFGLLGPNGAGKSTTINVVTGVSRRDAGDVRVFGWDTERDFRRTRVLVGVVHQELVAEPFFRIGQALRIHSGYYGVRDDPAWRELLIERLALGPHLGKTMTKLSGGMKRRFMVAKALLHKPRLLILDEPTAGVDVDLRRALWEFVEEMNRAGTTVLLTTHYLEEAERMCRRIAIMNEGRIVACEETHKLVKRFDRRTVTVRLRRPDVLSAEALTRLGGKTRENGAVAEFCLAPGSEMGALLEKLLASGAGIADIETRQATLEDVFLSVTGRDEPAAEAVP